MKELDVPLSRGQRSKGFMTLMIHLPDDQSKKKNANVYEELNRNVSEKNDKRKEKMNMKYIYIYIIEAQISLKVCFYRNTELSIHFHLVLNMCFLCGFPSY